MAQPNEIVGRIPGLLHPMIVIIGAIKVDNILQVALLPEGRPLYF